MKQADEMSGREVLEAMLSGDLPNPTMAETLSFSIVEVDEGRVVFEGLPGERHLHPGGVVHGGYALTLIDSAAGGAANTLRPASMGIGTIETHVNLVRPITLETGRVRATGQVISRGRTVVTAEARLTDASDRLLAHGTSTLLIFDR